MTSSIKLPKNPKVITRGKSVVVLFQSGTEIPWGDEKTLEEATRVAKELEIELRAVKYVQNTVHAFITEMREYLRSLDIDDKLLDSILIDGHAFARSQIDKETANTIISGAKRGLRKEVLQHLASDDFIV